MSEISWPRRRTKRNIDGLMPIVAVKVPHQQFLAVESAVTVRDIR